MDEVFSIWGSREGYVSLPRKLLTSKEYGSKNNKGKWEEKSFQWDNSDECKARISKWVKESIEQGYNIYWCPTVLDSPKRKKESISKVYCFYADLDDIPLDNLTRIPLKPSILWETSKKRYSAVWKLDKPLDADVAEMVNKFITYTLEADSGGWDLTQVLRVPRSPNFKYETAYKGKVLSFEPKALSSQQIQPILIQALKETHKTDETHEDYSENPLDLNEILSEYDLSDSLIQLINLSEDYILTQDRSKRLWQIECELRKHGVTRDDCISIILKSNWNKYKGRKDEQLRVITEVDKVYATKSVTHKTEATEYLSLTSYSDFMSENLPQPEWLVEDWWQLSSHGMVSGEPKTYKSTLITDMIVSVASGVPFLGKFPVHHTGPVIYIQEENAPVLVKDRVLKVTSSRGLLGKATCDKKKLTITPHKELPIYFMNNKGFDLTSEEYRSFLEEQAEKIKPVLVVFDPLYLMLGDKDENSSKDVRDVLRWLVGFRYKFDCAVIVLHHWNKNSKTARGGQRMLGSTLFHAWVESAIYCAVSNESQQEITVERELRSFHKPDKIVIKLIMGEPGDTTYDVKIVNEISTKAESITNLLAQYPEGLSIKQVSNILSAKSTRVKEELVKLTKEGLVTTAQKADTIIFKLKGEPPK